MRGLDASTPQEQRPRRRVGLFQVLGPGLVTGASDDDPSGIATYSQAGAQYGYNLGWTLVLTWPLMCAIQEISARVGRVTGRGLAGNLRRHYSGALLYPTVALLFVANTINLGADLGAMADSLRLLIGGEPLVYVAGFGLLSLGLEVFVRYARYVAILKWMTVSLLAYVGVAFVVKAPWAAVAQGLVLPEMKLDASTFTVIVAIFGTTISPYLFFWQAGEEVDEVRDRPGAKPLERDPDAAPKEFGRIRIDTYIGMAFSNATALFIVITAAATLHAHGLTNIQTSAQAAEALRPIAGPFAFLVFALGVIGTGLLAVPVLAGSAAYALGESFGWHVGLTRKLGRAKAFYAAIGLAVAAGAALNLAPINPVKALFWSAVINGVTAVPVMVMTMLLASRRAVMGRFAIPPVLKAVGWLATGAMALAAAGLLVTTAWTG